MNLSALFPPTLIKRVVDDIGAVADAARRLPEFEAQLLDRLDRIELTLAQIGVVREAVAPLSGQLERLEATVLPIQELPAVRRGIEPLDEDMRAVRHSVSDLEPLLREANDRLESLRNDLAPLGQLAEKVPGVG